MNYQVTKTALKSGRFIVLCLYLIFVLFPIYWMVVTSLKGNAEIINTQELTYFPQKFTSENYNQLFSMYDYGNMLKNSVTVCFRFSAATPLPVINLKQKHCFYCFFS